MRKLHLVVAALTFCFIAPSIAQAGPPGTNPAYAVLCMVFGCDTDSDDLKGGRRRFKDDEPPGQAKKTIYVESFRTMSDALVSDSGTSERR